MMSNKRFIPFHENQICFQTQGTGSVIVLLHGFLESMEMWRRMADDLARKNRVILIDLPGHGQSDQISETHSMELMAEAVNEVLVYTNTEAVVMIGHSMGGYVSLAFAEKYPEKIMGLGIFHSHALADTTEAKISRGRAIQAVKENHKDFISHFIPDLFTPQNQQLLAKEIEQMQSEARLMTKDSVIASLEGMRRRTDKVKLLSQLNVPVFFIIGKQDPRNPLEKMYSQIGLPKHVEVLILENVAHMGYLESYSVCQRFIDHFIGTCWYQ
jgi:pimeloyl-ACP methyl ester carboxylesterase